MIIITIDGPAGAGKSSVARKLAGRLGFDILDTGATYRAVTYAAFSRGVDLADDDAMARLAGEIDIRVEGPRVTVDGTDVSDAIRTPEVTSAIHFAADNPAVREKMAALQRRLAAGRDIVTEGRDQGTVVFPDAAVKIFLTASPEERARRRHAELVARGATISYEETLATQEDRDRRDAARPIGALKRPPGAVEVATDGMDEDAVVQRLVEVVQATAPGIGSPANGRGDGR